MIDETLKSLQDANAENEQQIKRLIDNLPALVEFLQSSTLKGNCKKIEEFNKAYELPFITSPGLPPMQHRLLRIKLLQEELDELEGAYLESDLVEVADAIVDILYLAFGAAVEAGLQNKLQELFNEVHDTNMAKLHEGKIVRNEAGKVLKPDNWQPPKIKEILFNENK